MAKTKQISPLKPHLSLFAKDYQCGVLAVDHNGQLFIVVRESGGNSAWASLKDGHTQTEIVTSRIVDADESYEITQS